MGRALERESGEWGLRPEQSPNTHIFIPGLMGRLNEKMQASLSQRPDTPQRLTPGERLFTVLTCFPIYTRESGRPFLFNSDHQIQEPATVLLEDKGLHCLSVHRA